MLNEKEIKFPIRRHQGSFSFIYYNLSITKRASAMRSPMFEF